MKKVYPLQVVILAAGHGTRMNSTLPKILHSLGGRPALYYVLDLAHRVCPQETVLVVSPPLKDIKTPFSHKTIVQHPALGTGDALKHALPFIKEDGHVLVLYGDTPLIQQNTLEHMLALSHSQPDLATILLGMRPEESNAYARLILNEEGGLEDVVEWKDLSPSQKEISLCNSGVMLIRADLLRSFLSSLKTENAAQEYYLTDLVKIARQQGYRCGVVEGYASEFMGINTRQDLATAETILQNRWREHAMEAGATLRDPSQVYFSYDTKITSDVVVHPFVTFGPGVSLEEGAQIFSFCHLSDTHVGPGACVGPFAHLRGGVILEDKAEIGNFVEVKKSTFGKFSKAKHLSYIGDTEVGPRANVGAGTITCNYDGFNKSKTSIGEGAFIGSNCALIAPLSIGEHAIIGAGSVVSEDIQSHALAVARPKTTILEKGAVAFRAQRQSQKES